MLDLETELLIHIYKYLEFDLYKIPMLSRKSYNIFDKLKNMIIVDMFAIRGWQIDINVSYKTYIQIYENCKYLLRIPCSLSSTILKIAIKRNKSLIVDIYIKNNVNIQKNSRKLFRYAIIHNQLNVAKYCKDQGVSISTYLFEKNGHLLYYIVENKFIDLLKFVFDQKIDISEHIHEMIETTLKLTAFDESDESSASEKLLVELLIQSLVYDFDYSKYFLLINKAIDLNKYDYTIMLINYCPEFSIDHDSTYYMDKITSVFDNCINLSIIDYRYTYAFELLMNNKSIISIMISMREYPLDELTAAVIKSKNQRIAILLESYELIEEIDPESEYEYEYNIIKNLIKANREFIMLFMTNNTIKKLVNKFNNSTIEPEKHHIQYNPKGVDIYTVIIIDIIDYNLTEFMELLLDNGLNLVNFNPENGDLSEMMNYVLKYAIKRNALPIIKLFTQYNIDFTFIDNDTLMHIVRNKQLEMIRILIEQGADMTSLNGYVLDIPAVKTHYLILELLLENNIKISI